MCAAPQPGDYLAEVAAWCSLGSMLVLLTPEPLLKPHSWTC